MLLIDTDGFAKIEVKIICGFFESLLALTYTTIPASKPILSKNSISIIFFIFCCLAFPSGEHPVSEVQRTG